MGVIFPYVSKGWYVLFSSPVYDGFLQIKVEMAHKILQVTLIYMYSYPYLSCSQRVKYLFCFVCNNIALPSISLLPCVKYVAQAVIHNFIYTLRYITQFSEG